MTRQQVGWGVLDPPRDDFEDPIRHETVNVSAMEAVSLKISHLIIYAIPVKARTFWVVYPFGL